MDIGSALALSTHLAVSLAALGLDIGSAFALSAPLAVGLAAFGSGIGLGLAVKGAMEALGRQPESSGKILTIMIIGAALIEALTIYALIVFFIIIGKTG